MAARMFASTAGRVAARRAAAPALAARSLSTALAASTSPARRSPVAAAPRASWTPVRHYSREQDDLGEEEEDFDDDDFDDDEPTRAQVGHPVPVVEELGVVINEEIGTIDMFDELFGDGYKVLLFYPKDFTYVCPTELIAFSDAAKKFEALNTKVYAISTDTAECHLAWIRTARKDGGLGGSKIPLVADVKKEFARLFGCLWDDAISLRGLFIIDGQGVLQHSTINNFPVGRSVDEALRVVEAFQFVEENGEVCPANWKRGDPTMKADAEGSKEYFTKVN